MLISLFCVNKALQVELLEMQFGGNTKQILNLEEMPNKYSVEDSSGQVLTRSKQALDINKVHYRDRVTITHFILLFVALGPYFGWRGFLLGP